MTVPQRAGPAAEAVADGAGAAERRAVELVRRVPATYRAYAQTADTARAVHRIGPGLLARLTRYGLPCAGSGPGVLYDKLDLLNVSALLGLRSAWYLGQRGWAASLASLATGEPVTFEIEAFPRCPYPGHPGGCGFELQLVRTTPDDVPSEGAVAALTGPGMLTVRTGHTTCAAPPQAAEVLAVVSDADYLNLPVDLETDLGFFDRSAVADCRLAAEAVAREAARRGAAIRRSFGLVLVPPYAGLHNWVEFQAGDGWASFDPHLIRYLESAGVLPRGWWPPLRSLGGLLLRLGDTGTNTSLATHRGLHADVSFKMRRMA